MKRKTDSGTMCVWRESFWKSLRLYRWQTIIIYWAFLWTVIFVVLKSVAMFLKMFCLVLLDTRKNGKQYFSKTKKLWSEARFAILFLEYLVSYKYFKFRCNNVKLNRGLTYMWITLYTAIIYTEVQYLLKKLSFVKINFWNFFYFK